MKSITRTTQRLAVFVAAITANVALYAGPIVEQGGQTKAPAPTVTLATKPSPPATGQTTFTVTVKAPDGKPVIGADVSLELVMPAMPAMKMAEMRNKVALKPAADPKLAAAGTYTGSGQVMMAGAWNVTVTVKLNGKDYAELKQTLTTK
jgi:hypothetical protein